MQPGDLVGLIGSKGPELALIEAISGSRARLRAGWDARSQTIPVRQIDLLAPLPGVHEPPTRLDQPPWQLVPSVLAVASPGRRDLGAAWLLLAEAPPEEGVSLEEFTELVAGADSPAVRAACWCWLQQGEQHLFRWRQGRVHPRSLRDLRQLRHDRHRQVLEERRLQHWHGLLRQRTPLNPAELDPAQTRQLQQLLAFAGGEIEELPDPELRRGLQAAHCAAEPGPVRRLLVDLGQWQPHALPSLRNSVWEQGFDPALLEDAERLLAQAELEQPGDGSRRDLTALRSYTLDDADTEEIDDAVALESLAGGGWRLWVHIADPGRLVASGSPLDLEARRRASSLYLASGVVPMFPLPLAVGPFSLRQGQRCAAWSCAMELAEDGSVAHHELVRSWIRPTYRLTYSDGDALIDLAPPEEPDLAQLQRLLERRRRWREAQGALSMEQSEGRIRCKGGHAELEITDPSPARALVAEAMILTGSVVAAHAAELGLAMPFRGQPASELPPESELQALPDGPVRHAALRRCLSRGSTSAAVSPHFSLGLPAYVQVTSPIRRYADLVAQRQLAASLAGQEPLEATQMEELLEELDPVIREGIQISREDQRHWQQVWFEQHRGERWQAIFLRWLRPQDRLALVHLEALAMDQAVRAPESCQPGDALTVQVQQVDSLSDLLRLEAR